MNVTIYQGHHVPQAKGICVVIDVLRAFTTAAFAFASGAKEIVLVSTPEEAFEKYKNDPSLVLMGEREGLPIEGFHFENSPTQMKNVKLQGSRMVQRTSSGTQGVIGCRHASHILLASFVVAEATYRRILELNPNEVSLIVTGRKNGDEDFALAEYLKSKIEGKPADVKAALHRVRMSPAAQRMMEGPQSYKHWQSDLELALKVDCFPFAMEVYKEGNELIGRAKT